MDPANYLLASRSWTRRGASEITRLGHCTQSSVAGSEWPRGTGVQSRWRLCRCGRHCGLHPIHPRIAASKRRSERSRKPRSGYPASSDGVGDGQARAMASGAEAAELYERYVARYILGPWAPLLVDAARVATGERVLDVACGTGVVARVAAKRVGPAGRVVGVDLNPGMIGVARSLPAPVGATIEWLERSALDLRLENARFDVVLCQQGLQFFPDKAARAAGDAPRARPWRPSRAERLEQRRALQQRRW